MDIKTLSFDESINSQEEVYDLGDCKFSLLLGELYSKNGEDYIHLEKKVAEVLACLVAAKGKVVTRQTIFDTVWPNQVVSDDSLNRCISVLRRKLREFNHNVSIKTHPKIGFHVEFSTLNEVQEKTTEPPKVSTHFTLDTTMLDTEDSQIKFSKKTAYIFASTLLVITISILMIFQQVSERPLETSYQTTQPKQLKLSRIIITPFQIDASLETKYMSLDEALRLIVSNHPTLSSISSGDIPSNAHFLMSTDIAQQFSGRFIIKGEIYPEDNRDILHWWVIDGKNGDALYDMKTNLALLSTHHALQNISSKLIERLSLFIYPDSLSDRMMFLTQSAEYLFTPSTEASLQHPVINMLANAITEQSPNSAPALKTLSSLLLKQVDELNNIEHPYYNLALNSLKKAIELSPGDFSLYQSLSTAQTKKYLWLEAHNTIQKAVDYFKAQNITLDDPFRLLKYQTGNITSGLISHYIEQHKAYPFSVEHSLRLATAFAQQGEDQKALEILNSQIIKTNEWGKSGIHLGATLIRLGEIELGKTALFAGYRTFGISDSYIDALYQGILNPAFRPQAIDLLSLASSNDQLPSHALLYMYAELGALEQYYQLAFLLANNYQYSLFSVMESNSTLIRADGRFLPLMKEINLYAYWEEFGFPKDIDID